MTQQELEAMFNEAAPAQQDLASLFEKSAPVATAPVQRDRTIIEELGRQLGLTGRAVIEGVGSIPNMLGDVAGLRSTQGVHDLLTRAGFPVADTELERLSQGVVGAGASVAVPGGVGASMARAGSSPVVRGVGQQLSADMGKQAALSGIGGGAAEMVAEGGGGSLEQLGAGIGAATLAQLLARGVSPIAKRIGQVVDSAVPGGGATRAAGRVAVDVSKDRAGAVARALKMGEPVETAAQAAVPAGSAEFAGLENMVAGRKPSVFGPEGTVSRNTEDYINQLWKDLNESTKSLREAELSGANIAGEIGTKLKQQIAEKQASLAAALQTGGKAATESAQQAVLADRPLAPVQGMPRISGRYSHNTDRVPEWAGAAADTAAIAGQRRAEAGFRQNQLDSIAAHGMKPLTVDNVINSIDTKLSTPGLRASDTASTVLGVFKSKIGEFVGPDGVIDSRDLYMIRKEMGNKIKTMAQQERWDKVMTEGLVHDVQRAIDEAIGSASGSLRRDGTSDWTDYLKAYSTGAKRIEAIGERSDIAARTGAAGREEAKRVFNAEEIPITLPNLLSRPVMAANAIIKFLEGRGGQRTTEELARLMQPQNKAELAALMEKELASRGGKQPIGNALRRAIVAGGYGGTVGGQ